MLHRIHLVALLTFQPLAVAPFSPALFSPAKACHADALDSAAAACTATRRSAAPRCAARGRQVNAGTDSESDRRSTQEEGSDSDPASEIEKPPVPEGSHEELMYALGVNLARQLGDVRPLVESGAELACVAKGLLDTVVGRITEDGQTELLKRRREELNHLVQSRAFLCYDPPTAVATRNAIRDRLEQAGRDMLEEMKKAGGAKSLPSGVVLHVLDHGPDGPGRGKRATKASAVRIHYHGTLADGTTFDTTLGSDPVTIPLAAVIPGWREGVLNMHEGETAMLGIPPSQGYGDAGTPDGRIPGGSTLFFKIQLLEVLTASIGGSPELLGADGKKFDAKKTGKKESGLLGSDGRPM